MVRNCCPCAEQPGPLMPCIPAESTPPSPIPCCIKRLLACTEQALRPGHACSMPNCCAPYPVTSSAHQSLAGCPQAPIMQAVSAERPAASCARSMPAPFAFNARASLQYPAPLPCRKAKQLPTPVITLQGLTSPVCPAQAPAAVPSSRKETCRTSHAGRSSLCACCFSSVQLVIDKLVRGKLLLSGPASSSKDSSGMDTWILALMLSRIDAAQDQYWPKSMLSRINASIMVSVPEGITGTESGSRTAADIGPTAPSPSAASWPAAQKAAAI